MSEPFFAQCPRGLAGVLATELAALGAVDCVGGEAGVAFAGDWAVAYRANLESRIATRILWRVAEFDYRDEHDIYDATFLLPWSAWFLPERTLKVEISAHRAPVQSLDFTTLKVKDAICDKFREVCGKRPSIARREPDIRVHAHLEATRAALYLDLSGEALFKRGRRDETGVAPLKKNLAAGIIALSGWRPDDAFLDPMCGSGTFLVEAAEIALGIAPGLSGGAQRPFALERLLTFDARLWSDTLAAARARAAPVRALALFGSDLYGDVLKQARENLAANGILDAVQLKQANVVEISAPAPSGVWVTNPPYGERLGDAEALARLYPALGDVLKKKFTGWRAYFFTSDFTLAKAIRLSASKRTPLYNGKIECRLFEYKIVAGTNRAGPPTDG
ncbi:MAG TPA: THUMP domain-containing protein [Usitatibacteraceae bacterium]|nr:THUMP domain-containing protein [Usitatibacteraceae bacterium]